MYQPLSRQQVVDVIEGRGAGCRVPMMIHFWVNPQSFGEHQAAAQRLLDKYPMDVTRVNINLPQIHDAPADDPTYRWVNHPESVNDQKAGLDEQIAIRDWQDLSAIAAEFPNPEYPGLLPHNPPDDGRYRLGCFWFCLFERHWSLRGMMNALTDYYEHPDEVHILFRHLTDFYLAMMERGRKECSMDGIFTSDDLGTQTSSFISPAIFHEFFLPYYQEITDKAHALGMHFWLHACGNIEAFMPDFVRIGLDVIHPIQKYTMDERIIALKYGKDICIWAGFDVQQIIPYGTPDQVREEVRFMLDTYFRPDGRLMLTAGNGITPDCMIDSLEALLDECFHYGSSKAPESVRKLAKSILMH